MYKIFDEFIYELKYIRLKLKSFFVVDALYSFPKTIYSNRIIEANVTDICC